MVQVLIIAATRRDQIGFEGFTHLGISLKRLAYDPRIERGIAYQNVAGLPHVFNSYIVPENENKILIFTHDDVWMDDLWLTERLDEALAKFQVVGVAGNRRRVPHQPAWHLTPTGEWDTDLSGAVRHLTSSGVTVTYYGPAKERCSLLDGVFIAAKGADLLAAKVKFDEQFTFHFYDLDFCRTAETAKLTIGTWPISVTHGGVGAFGSPDWIAALELYRQKWGKTRRRKAV